jgi:hypothetical protein
MLAKLLALVFVLSGCSLLPFKSTPLQIKAVIEGEIKGHHIHCEKTLNLGNGKWGIMCRLGNDMDVKYRIRSITKDQTQIEFLVGKAKEGRHKIIAAPTVMVNKAHSTRTVTSAHNANIMVMAELIK